MALWQALTFSAWCYSDTVPTISRSCSARVTPALICASLSDEIELLFLSKVAWHHYDMIDDGHGAGHDDPASFLAHLSACGHPVLF